MKNEGRTCPHFKMVFPCGKDPSSYSEPPQGLTFLKRTVPPISLNKCREGEVFLQRAREI